MPRIIAVSLPAVQNLPPKPSKMPEEFCVIRLSNLPYFIQNEDAVNFYFKFYINCSYGNLFLLKPQQLYVMPIMPFVFAMKYIVKFIFFGQMKKMHK